jgi:hypothetical protein
MVSVLPLGVSVTFAPAASVTLSRRLLKLVTTDPLTTFEAVAAKMA